LLSIIILVVIGKSAKLINALNPYTFVGSIVRKN